MEEDFAEGTRILVVVVVVAAVGVRRSDSALGFPTHHCQCTLLEI